METDDAGDNVVPITSVRKRTRPDLEPWEDDLLAKLLVDRKTSKSGEVTTTMQGGAANLATILQHHPDWAGVLALNVFHHRIEATRVPPWHALDAPTDPKAGPWSDGDTARTANWFSRTWICGMKPIRVGQKLLDPAILVAAEANSYHPVRDYLNGLEWDSNPRIDTFAANYLGGDLSAYTCAVGAAFLIGCVARVMQPGCKLDTCIVLEGRQGKFKSTALEVLAGEWFADSKLAIGDKDGMQALAGVWLYELAELASFGKSDVETHKAFLSSRKDHYRPSYGRYAIDVPRQTAFAGTTNAGQYLQDETGGRRFNPLKTGDINIVALRADRDQLWAEALHRYRGGSPWWLDDALTSPEQADRFVVDEWQERIATYLRIRTSTTVHDILNDLIFRDVTKEGDERNTLSRWEQKHSNRVARCLTGLGWVRRRAGSRDSRSYHYVPRCVPVALTPLGANGTREPQ